jgi:excisionase family DNA binding protein
MAELTTAQAAELAGVPERTLRRWVTSGHLAATRRGRWYRIRPEDLAAIGATSGQERPEAERPSAASAASAAMAEGMAEHLAELVRLVERQQQTILELSGRCGFLQAENQQLRLALEAPKVAPEPTPTVEAVSRPATPIWRALVGWLGG